MKASEALRKGMGMVKGQNVCTFYCPELDTACALGCMLLGHGVLKSEVNDFSLSDLPTYIRSGKDKYKEYYKTTIDLDNDLYGKSLAEIAQRLEDIGE